MIEKYKFENLWTAEEIQNKQKEETRRKQSLERCLILYEKGKIKNYVNTIMYQKNEELKIQNEMKECSWKPKLTKINKKLEENIKIFTRDTKIYDRSIQWKIKTEQKINRSKSELQRENIENTFKPSVRSFLI